MNKLPVSRLFLTEQGHFSGLRKENLYTLLVLATTILISHSLSQIFSMKIPGLQKLFV